MKQIIFATSNEGKMREIRMLLADMDYQVLSLKEAGIDIDIIEDGKTFEDNAVIKAKAVSALVDAIVLADDSGLEVDFLNKEPGVYSARYLGEDTPYDVKNRTIIERLASAAGEERAARFVCVIAAVFPDGKVITTKGTMEGEIAYTPAGGNGFGYDPILYLPELKKTSAELSPEQKNTISHRGKALCAMKEKLREGV